jgi:hypothetical protein
VGDALRSTRQALRDDFHGRAQLLERSAHEALRAAQQVSAMGSDQQRTRQRDLSVQQRQLSQVRSTARQVAKVGSDD